jgi:hypothetical protein
MGIGCAVSSYNHRMYFGLLADADLAPDVRRLKGFLDDAYDELRAAAGVERSAPRHHMEPLAQERRSA